MPGSVAYRIRLRVQGRLDAAWWSAVFSDLELTVEADGDSLISGLLADQTALHGLLATIRDLGLSLVTFEATAEQGPIPIVGDGDRNSPAAGSRTL